jgi:hypothetical protein
VENNTISYSLVQEGFEQPKEYSESPREANHEMNRQTKTKYMRSIPWMVHNVEFSEPDREGSIQKSSNAS